MNSHTTLLLAVEWLSIEGSEMSLNQFGPEFSSKFPILKDTGITLCYIFLTFYFTLFANNLFLFFLF